MLSCLFLSTCQKPSSSPAPTSSDLPPPIPDTTKDVILPTPIPTLENIALPTETHEPKETHRPPDAREIPIGSSPEELVAKIDELGYEIEMPDYSKYEEEWPENFIRDGRIYGKRQNADGTEEWCFGYSIKSPNIYTSSTIVRYNINEEFELMGMDSIGQSTAEGLANGDSFDKMIEIYREDYAKFAHPLGDAYRYFNGNEYIFVIYHNLNVIDKQDSIVSRLVISIYPIYGDMEEINE